MHYLFFWRKYFSPRLTVVEHERLYRLAHCFTDKSDDIDSVAGSVLDRAFALYSQVADWRKNPLFKQESDGDFVPCRLKDLTTKSSEQRTIRLFFRCSWSEWKFLNRVLRDSNDDDLLNKILEDPADSDLSIIADRALQLLEMVIDGQLSPLFVINNEGDFEPTTLEETRSV